MMTPARVVRMIGIAGLVGWMGMVGWVAKTTQAQNGGQAPSPLPPAATNPESPPQAGSRRPSSTTGCTRFSSRLDIRQVHVSTSPVADEPRAARDWPTRRLLRPRAAFQISSITRSASSSDDPEQSAQSFVERNQKEAEDHLKALTAEAQQLRGRLAKLESGIKKWQGLVNALKSSQGQSIASTANAAGAEDAGDLEPIKTARAGAARADKRVKWATATSAAPAPAAAGAQPGDHVDPPQQQPAAQPQPLQVGVPGYVPR